MSAESHLPLSRCRVAILGLGLMGGSLGLALKGKCALRIGLDPDRNPVSQALSWDVVDVAATSPTDLLPAADLVVLAAPVGAILTTLAELPRLHPGSPVVIDLGSTKAKIVEAMETLPARFAPIGGHPMCGKEKSGLAAAEAGLFNGAAFALTPLERTPPSARLLAEELVQAVGARPLCLEASEHDRWTAATSHFPYLLSNALAAGTPLQAAPLIGPGFRSTSRLAGSSINMMADILTTNRDNVLACLERFEDSLAALRAALDQDDAAALHSALEAGRSRYADLTERRNGKL